MRAVLALSDKVPLGSRNDALFDAWSAVHFTVGLGAAWVVDPVIAWIVMALWEPLEIFLISPLLHRVAGLEFGHESWRNSLSDVFFNTLGVLVGFFLLRRLVQPPFLVP